MSSNLCINCQNPFEEKAKGYKRYSVNNSVAGKKITMLLDDFNIRYETQTQGFLCHMCYNLLGKSAMAASYEESFCARSKSAKRKMDQRTPVKTPRKTKRPTLDVGTSPFSPGHRITTTAKSTWKTRAITAIQKSKYFTAIKYLTKSAVGKRALQRYVRLEVRKEAAGYKKKGGELNKPVTQLTLQNFKWCNIITDLKQNFPLLHACLTGAITNRTNENRKLKIDGCKFGPGIPSVGLVFSVLMYQRHPMKFCFIQELCALEMWSSGCAQKMYQCFQHLGISKGQKGAISAVDRLRKEFDSEIKSWKQEIETEFQPLHRPRAGARMQLFPDVPNDSESSSDNENLIADIENFSDDGMNEDQDISVKHPGFCMVWDNVQVMATVRHQTSTKQNQMLLWALAFAVKNRIGFRELSDGNTIRAQDMPLHTFLPSQNDYDSFRNRMEVIVMRILKQHLPAFNDCEVVEHIPHDYSEDSRKKSRIVNLGVFDENPSSTAGVISIMDHLHQYVPSSGREDFFTIPCHGDGLSIERMRDAKGSRSASETKAGRLEGLEPVPQEFHKRMLIMQDTMNELYSGSSGADRGSLFHIRNTFNHRNVTKSVGSSFNHIADLIQFSTEGLSTILAMKMCGIKKQEDRPPLLPLDMKKRTDYLLEITKAVVDTIWYQVSMEDISAVIDADEDDDDTLDFYEYCACKQDTGESMVKCSNIQCDRGRWFHLTCMGIDPENIPECDWWCCVKCEATRQSRYCKCHIHRPAEATVRCSKGRNCLGGQIYHLDCLGISVKPRAKWLCESCKKKKKSTPKEDHTFLYTCTLLFRGLADLVKKDAVRENDGVAITEHWRIDMPNFWQGNHNKYLILGHKYLADVHGWQSPRLRNEIMWNRTANIKGGAGHNLPLDLVNEFLNRDFKENLKTSKGKYGDQNIARTSQFVGSLSKDLDRVFQQQVSGTMVKQQSGGSNDYVEDIKKFVIEYHNDKLFDIIPGREHSAYPGFTTVLSINKPVKLKTRLKKYSFKLDRSRDILP